jgi:hypothetical protein
MRDVVRPEDHVDVGQLFEGAPRHAVDAPSDGDDGALPMPVFESFERSDLAPETLVCVLANATRHEDDHVGLLG